VRLLNGGIESSSSSLVLEYSKVPKKMDKDKNLDETKKMYFPLLSESAENNVRALLSEGQCYLINPSFLCFHFELHYHFRVVFHFAVFHFL
jgi:hypothetical protein